MLKDRTHLRERRNASQLARKISANNRGRLRLKKPKFAKSNYCHAVPPSYLQSLSNKHGYDDGMTAEIYCNTIDYLNRVGCLDKISSALIRDYVIARCNCIQTLKNLVQSDMPVLDMDKNRLSPLLDVEITMGENMSTAWKPIGAIAAQYGSVSSVT